MTHCRGQCDQMPHEEEVAFPYWWNAYPPNGAKSKAPKRATLIQLYEITHGVFAAQQEGSSLTERTRRDASQEEREACRQRDDRQRPEQRSGAGSEQSR
jgi:hypothetical protein